MRQQRENALKKAKGTLWSCIGWLGDTSISAEITLILLILLQSRVPTYRFTDPLHSWLSVWYLVAIPRARSHPCTFYCTYPFRLLLYNVTLHRYFLSMRLSFRRSVWAVISMLHFHSRGFHSKPQHYIKIFPCNDTNTTIYIDWHNQCSGGKRFSHVGLWQALSITSCMESIREYNELSNVSVA